MITEIEKTIKQIEDDLIPFLKLDTYEKTLYYHLFRHSRLIGKNETKFVISRAPSNVGITKHSARDRIRKLAQKGCIKILETARDGILVKVMLPSEIEGCISKALHPIEDFDIEKADFFKTPELRLKLLERENKCCFYCMKSISEDNYAIDHLISQANAGNNTYKNLVASCHECNSKKGGENGDDFARKLYRNGTLSSDELKETIQNIERLKSGDLKPDV